MKKKKVIIISLISLSLLLIIGGISYSLLSKEQTPPPKKYTYNDANIASQYYRSDDRKVDIVDKKDGFHILVYDKETEELLNEFVMDKETGIISEIPTVHIITQM